MRFDRVLKQPRSKPSDDHNSAPHPNDRRAVHPAVAIDHVLFVLDAAYRQERAVVLQTQRRQDRVREPDNRTVLFPELVDRPNQQFNWRRCVHLVEDLEVDDWFRQWRWCWYRWWSHNCWLLWLLLFAIVWCGGRM